MPVAPVATLTVLVIFYIRAETVDGLPIEVPITIALHIYEIKAADTMDAMTTNDHH